MINLLRPKMTVCKNIIFTAVSQLTIMMIRLNSTCPLSFWDYITPIIIKDPISIIFIVLFPFAEDSYSILASWRVFSRSQRYIYQRGEYMTNPFSNAFSRPLDSFLFIIAMNFWNLISFSVVHHWVQISCQTAEQSVSIFPRIWVSIPTLMYLA